MQGNGTCAAMQYKYHKPVKTTPNWFLNASHTWNPEKQINLGNAWQLVNKYEADHEGTHLNEDR